MCTDRLPLIVKAVHQGDVHPPFPPGPLPLPYSIYHSIELVFICFTLLASSYIGLEADIGDPLAGNGCSLLMEILLSTCLISQRCRPPASEMLFVLEIVIS